MLGIDVPSESSQASLPTEPPERPAFYPSQEEGYGGDASATTGTTNHLQQVEVHPPQHLQLQQQQLTEHANPFELADCDNDYADVDEDDMTGADAEMLDVHNRSTQLQDNPQHQQMPSRVIDNGIAHQFRVES